MRFERYVERIPVGFELTVIGELLYVDNFMVFSIMIANPKSSLVVYSTGETTQTFPPSELKRQTSAWALSLANTLTANVNEYSANM
jgi:hypothetical protein